MNRRIFLSAALWPMAQNAFSAGQKSVVSTIRFAGGLSQTDRRMDFAFALLGEALRAVGEKRPLEHVHGMTQKRRQLEILGGNVQVTTLPSVERQPNGVFAIPFPIRRGILGVRLLLALPNQAERIGAIKNLEQLKKMSMGYVEEWSDLKLLRGLGFKVITTSSYSGMFDLLRRGRVDYLSRGISEVWDELAEPSLAKEGIAVVPNVVLNQPLDDYFCIRANEGILAEQILSGIKRLHQTGAYTELFLRHFGTSLNKAKLAERRVFPVLGYGVRPNTPLNLFDAIDVDPATARFVIPE